MPTEVRRLVFSNDELYAALDQYLARTGTSLPSGSIVRMCTDAVHDVVKIDVSRGDRGSVDTIELQARQVGGALISYCITNQIPLPRGFVKSLIVSGDNIALEMTNATETLLLGNDRVKHMSTIDTDA
jgi:hypothetical protein